MKNEREPAIEVFIEELVLDGFAPWDRYTVGDAVVARLTESLRNDGSLRKMGVPVDVDRIHAGHAVLPAGPLGTRAGSAIALLVSESLGRMEANAVGQKNAPHRDSRSRIGSKR